MEGAVFSPNGHSYLTASNDNAVRLSETETGKEIAVLPGHTGTVTAAAFSPDGRSILTASDDNTARLWDAGRRASRLPSSGDTRRL